MAELSTVARPYVRAAFNYALEHDQIDAWSEQLGVLAAISEHEKLGKIISAPELSAKAKAQVFIDLGGEGISQPMANFVHLLADKSRLTLLPEMSRQFAELKTAHEQSYDVQLTTAIALDETSQDKLIKALTEKLERPVNIRASVDQNLLAGVVIKVGDMVIDGSMRGRLDKLAKAINS